MRAKRVQHKPRVIGAGLAMTIITDQQGEPTAVQLRVDLYGGFIREIVIDAADMDAFAQTWMRERQQTK